MIEILSAWVIVGAGGIRYGSFNDLGRAQEYALALTIMRGLPCQVVSREELN
jgi:hypothetical protein